MTNKQKISSLLNVLEKLAARDNKLARKESSADDNSSPTALNKEVTIISPAQASLSLSSCTTAEPLAEFLAEPVISISDKSAVTESDVESVRDEIREMVANHSIEQPKILNFEKSADGEEVYPGDYVDEQSTNRTQYKPLDIPDPAALVCLFDEDLRNAKATLHPWQVITSEELASAKPTSKHPHKFCLCAANGSGKDKYVIAPFCIWFAIAKIRSRVILTSSSGVQLTSQTESYIKDLAEKVNAYFGEEVFSIRQRYIKCLWTSSEIRMFATDEKGKAEGYHPWDVSSEMAIIVNEGKTVTDDIHEALKRCTGFNYWLEVSTPGEPKGFFYDAATNWKHIRRVTSYDCPHLSEDEREDDKRKLGEHSAFFRSKHLALFTSIGGQVIIPFELVESIVKNPPSVSYESFPVRVGIDLAAGGDENALCFSKGNKCLREYSFREIDTTITADRIDQILKNEKIDKSYNHIYADDGGVGHAILDQLERKGWSINRIHNQWSSLGNRKMYGNRGAENWFRVKRLFEELIFDASTLGVETRKQLCGRHYKQTLVGGRIFLEAKKEARAHGRLSPDRADAFILSMTGLTIDDFLDAKSSDAKVENKKPSAKQEHRFSSQTDLEEQYDEITYRTLNNKTPVHKKRCFNSLREAMKN